MLYQTPAVWDSIWAGRRPDALGQTDAAAIFNRLPQSSSSWALRWKTKTAITNGMRVGRGWIPCVLPQVIQAYNGWG